MADDDVILTNNTAGPQARLETSANPDNGRWTCYHTPQCQTRNEHAAVSMYYLERGKVATTEAATIASVVRMLFRHGNADQARAILRGDWRAYRDPGAGT